MIFDYITRKSQDQIKEECLRQLKGETFKGQKLEELKIQDIRLVCNPNETEMRPSRRLNEQFQQLPFSVGSIKHTMLIKNILSRPYFVVASSIDDQIKNGALSRINKIFEELDNEQINDSGLKALLGSYMNRIQNENFTHVEVKVSELNVHIWKVTKDTRDHDPNFPGIAVHVQLRRKEIEQQLTFFGWKGEKSSLQEIYKYFKEKEFIKCDFSKFKAIFTATNIPPKAERIKWTAKAKNHLPNESALLQILHCLAQRKLIDKKFKDTRTLSNTISAVFILPDGKSPNTEKKRVSRSKWTKSAQAFESFFGKKKVTPAECITGRRIGSPKSQENP